MEVLQYAPVIIPTLNRYDHFKRCIESLEKCTGAEKTIVYVGLDYPPSEKYYEGWKKIDEYLHVKEVQNRFLSLQVERRDHNCGAGHCNSNGSLLQKRMEKEYEYYIFTEDDNEFSPCFLEYINKALLKYRDDDRVVGISGYQYPVEYSNIKTNTFFYHGYTAWGVARWRHKFSIVRDGYETLLMSNPKWLFKIWEKDSRTFFQLLLMTSLGCQWGDLLHDAQNIIEDKLVLYPTISMCRNHGHDGTGLHCGDTNGEEDIYVKQYIQEQEHFDLDDIPIQDTIPPELKKYFSMSFIGKLSAIKHFCKYLISRPLKIL